MSYNGKRIELIAAVDKKWAIGYKNKLLISIPDDMKYFAELTTGNVCIMGKNTLQSLPGGRPLINRVNIVLTHDKKFTANGVVIVHSVEEALEEATRYADKKIFVIGGESVYRQFMPYVDSAYITYIDYAYHADRYIPNLDEDSSFGMTEESEEQTYFNVEYYYRKYDRMS